MQELEQSLSHERDLRKELQGDHERLIQCVQGLKGLGEEVQPAMPQPPLSPMVTRYPNPAAEMQQVMPPMSPVQVISIEPRLRESCDRISL